MEADAGLVRPERRGLNPPRFGPLPILPLPKVSRPTPKARIALRLAAILSFVFVMLGPRRVGAADHGRDAPEGPAGLPSIAGEYLVEQWTSDDGLPQNSVIGMAQTSDGYLWMSTFEGLARFDGRRFVVFDADRDPELERYYGSLVADPEGGLWLSLAGGQATYGKGSRFRRLGEADGLPTGRIVCIASAPDGSIWALDTQGGVLRHDRPRRQFVRHAEPAGPEWAGPGPLAVDRAGRLWIERQGRIAYYAEGRWHVVAFPESGRAGAGWVGMPDGSVLLEPPPSRRSLVRWEADRLTAFDRLPAPDGGSLVLRLDREQNLWALGQDSILRRTREGVWGRLDGTLALARSVPRVSFEDREGNLWIGTDGTGVFRLRRRYVLSSGTAEGMTRPVALSVSGTPDRVAVAVHGAGVQFLENGRFTIPPVVPDRPQDVLAWCTLAARDGSFWVGTFGGGLYRYRPGEAQAQRFHPTTHPGLIREAHFALCQDSRGRVWIGGEAGLSRWDGTGFRSWTTAQGLPHPQVNALADDEGGGVWVGSNRGLVRVRDHEVKVYTTADGLAQESVRSLLATGDGTLWIGGAGLSRWKAGRLSPIRPSEGLPASIIKSLIADDLGSLWLGTPRGLFRIELAQLEAFCDGRAGRIEFQHFDRTDGMPSVECSGYQPGSWKGADGRLWFATLNGLAIIDPRRLPRNLVPPPVVIETVTADGREIAPDPDEGGYTIPPRTGTLEFRYTAPSFVAPDRNRFRCRLGGFEERFRETGTERFATYTHPPPGRYAFQVLAANADGVWNETGATVALRVQPLFWQRRGFQAGAALLTLAAAGLVVRWFSQRRLLRQVAILEQDRAINRERARIARNMHDDVGASLTQIGLLSDLAQREPAGAEPRLRELGDLSREVVRSLDTLVWTVDPAHDTLAGLVEYLAGYAQSFLQPAGVLCRLDLPVQLPETAIPATGRHQILLLIKEALNNLIKHSGATEAMFSAQLPPGRLVLELRDNGRGFEPGTAGRFSDGLANMRRRAQSAGGTCEVRSEPGAGTRVRIELPVAG